MRFVLLVIGPSPEDEDEIREVELPEEIKERLYDALGDLLSAEADSLVLELPLDSPTLELPDLPVIAEAARYYPPALLEDDLDQLTWREPQTPRDPREFSREYRRYGQPSGRGDRAGRSRTHHYLRRQLR